MSGVIHRKDLDRMRDWLANVLQLPPGMGEVFFVAVADSEYETWFKTMGVDSDHLKTTPALAYAECTADKNDAILVAPGAYNAAATLDWTKDHTHLIGLGGPNTRSDYSEKNVVLYTDTAAVDFTIDLTGNHCQFINMGINNAGNDATSYAAMRVNGYGNYFKNVSFIGNLQGSQLSAVACASLYVHTNAHNCKWIDCDIGEDCWGSRTGALSGQLRFSSASQPNGGLFRNCTFRSQSVTTTVAMVAIPSNGAVGRGWVWDNCVFTNFAISSTNLNQVFYANDITGTSGYMVLHHCVAHGFDEWQDADYGKIETDMPVASAQGGLATEATQYFGET